MVLERSQRCAVTEHFHKWLTVECPPVWRLGKECTVDLKQDSNPAGCGGDERQHLSDKYRRHSKMRTWYYRDYRPSLNKPDPAGEWVTLGEERTAIKEIDIEAKTGKSVIYRGSIDTRIESASRVSLSPCGNFHAAFHTVRFQCSEVATERRRRPATVIQYNKTCSRSLRRSLQAKLELHALRAKH